MAEIAEYEAHIAALRESFRQRYGVSPPGLTHWSKKITVRAKVEMEFDADDRLTIVGRWLNLRYEGAGVVGNVQLVGEREVYGTVSEPAEDENEELDDDVVLEDEDGDGEGPISCRSI